MDATTETTTIRHPRTTFSDERLTKAARVFRNIADTLDETVQGKYFGTAAEEHNLDYQKLRQLLQTINSIDISTSTTKKKPLEIKDQYKERVELEPFEMGYCKIFGIPKSEIFNYEIPEDAQETLEYIAKQALSEREYFVFTSVCQSRTLESIGNDMGVQRERVRQIDAKAYRKMHYPRYVHVLELGLKEYNLREMIAKKAKEDANEEYHKKLEEDEKRTTFENLQKRILDSAEKIPVYMLRLSQKEENTLKEHGIRIIADLERWLEHLKPNSPIVSNIPFLQKVLTRYISVMNEYGLIDHAYEFVQKNTEISDILYSCTKDMFDEIEQANQKATEKVNKTGVYAISYEDLDLSVRSFNCLKRANCSTISEIEERIENKTLHKVRNLGRKSLTEVLYKYLSVMTDAGLAEQALNVIHSSYPEYEENIIF